ncbi:hypothetical protein A1Q2_01088 [Trichosporon asahii var. asahii CBS 8904]|uniref:Uncharacterized protein n=1 Tax=Trichosporon asahii var. asahii (strain CBS 8904) TaxID=1220162 RepID=K1W6V3_TRIAC|nr:hypothetical protein A1Q2_01088 [Trichosporon asahii var. asahii CBS 8904]
MVAVLHSSAPTPPDLAEGIQILGSLAHGALFVLEVIVNLAPLALLAALVVCIIGISPPSTDPTSSYTNEDEVSETFAERRRRRWRRRRQRAAEERMAKYHQCQGSLPRPLPPFSSDGWSSDEERAPLGAGARVLTYGSIGSM